MHADGMGFFKTCFFFLIERDTKKVPWHMPISIYVVISVISGLTATSKSVFSHKKKTFYLSKKPQFPLSSIKLGFKSLEKNILFYVVLFEKSTVVAGNLIKSTRTAYV